ncbi:FtsK/SpoIIIE domain-containing protein [Actinomadura viridis]|uniref:S-DNA-T family DNA segregation ATPase FtsK/SpoIIIE n=1 Tax=Actinomadura viridis TaxID=58110 RepID=A0A931DPK9_9ACTN|nr:cell division protein FtsK [Actinomadura viridis]MBG6092368.1 S-DNA-T family DNA segregation ATPase FtsK/SpoIIIE [Actinomadura viridis]
MTYSKPMADVIKLPTRLGDEPAPDSPAPSGEATNGPASFVPSAADGRHEADGPDRPDEGDALEGTVLVDQPDRRPSSVRTRIVAGTAAQRRPIIPPWLRDRQEAKALVRWSVNYAGHVTGYHAVRIPAYALTLAGRSPRGLWRLVSGTWRWVNDTEALPLRLHAVDGKDADTYLRLLRERDDRVRWRRLVALGGLCGGSVAAGAVAAAGGVTQTTVAVALVAVLGWLGTPKDKPLIGPAVVSTKAPKLTSEIIIRALGALGIAEINKALGKGGDGITFPSPITRDGPGWRADVDLPYGVTVTDIMERRERLASGLRRPVGCVWPEPAHDHHAGRLVLWVGDQDMSRVKPAAWPLAKSGRADVFKPIPFGTDQRGRLVTGTLMFANWLIGAMPRMGKTFSIKPLLLAAGLDVTAENLVYELKGTGDLSFAEKYAHRYGSGPDDATIAACLDGLRYVHKDLERRAKVLSSLPKDICPENKVTPEIAARRSLGLHPLGLFIDECQELFAHAEHGKEAAELATAIIKRGPAMGVFLVLATQRPDKDSLPTGVSANVGIRYCLRVMGQVENDMVLGTSAYRNGIRATTFTRRDLGIGYLVGEADDPQITRSFYIDGPTSDRIADRARALRKAAGALAGHAAGEEVTPSESEISVLEDVVAVIGADEDKIWSETILRRLAELRPSLYGPWTPAQLADALKPYGITTQQVWGQHETGKGANRRGIVREHVVNALDVTRARSR